jgi:hypothetical protein
VSQTPARLSTRIAIFCAIVFLLFVCAAEARDDSAEHHVRELAHRVSAELPRNKMSCVAWTNHEAVSEARSQQLKNAFAEELQGKVGDSAAAASGNCAVSVDLEKTPTQIVFTAGLENGVEKQHFFAAVSRAGIPTESAGPATPRLGKELLWQQNERILDAIFVRGENGARDRLIVLQKDALVVYEKQAGEWKAALTKPPGEAAVTQRAPRGEIYFSVEQPDRAKIVFAGKSCQANLGDASALNCVASSEAARTGMLLVSACDSRVWWLRGDGGDMTMPDHLELTIPSAQKTEVAVAELPMPGPVLSISSGEGVRADTAVVFNLATGNYEVYRIALACGQ